MTTQPPFPDPDWGAVRTASRSHFFGNGAWTFSSGGAWPEVTMHVTCPKSWTAEDRPPRLSAYSYAAPVGLGALPNRTWTAAPFWIRPRQGAARR